jgi:hypothetical protein
MDDDLSRDELLAKYVYGLWTILAFITACFLGSFALLIYELLL